MVTRHLGEQVRFQMEAFGVGEADFARIVGAEPRTVARWLGEVTYPQHAARAQLDHLATLADRLIDAFGTPEGSSGWVHAPAGYFGGLRPLDALLSGRLDLADAALEALESGVFV